MKANIGQFQAAGVSGNIFNPADWLKVIFGVGVILASISLVQRVGGTVGNATRGYVDLTPSPLFETPAVMPNKPSVNVYQ